MKIIFVFLVFKSVLLSANLLYLEQNRNKGIRTYCINDNYYYSNSNFYFYDLDSKRKMNIKTKNYQSISIYKGYEFKNDKCIFDSTNYYGLSYEEYNYLMSYIGILWGFLIALTLIMAV